ncbi:putative BTB/POZ domain-containing protein [Plasmopara halstedii]
MKHRELSRAAFPRKLRKSCSLPSCKNQCGTCMHCTCDGRCGHHAAGHCGGRREGSGRGCKRQDCTRDDYCLHSSRATCCHCRNLVSSAGRAAKRPRVTIPLLLTHSHDPCFPVSPVYRQDVQVGSVAQLQVSKTSDEVLEAELCAFLHDANLGGDLSLCEHDEWASRRQHCNLVVLVCGTQFNLHKFPMLWECRKLHRMVRQALEENANKRHLGGAVPILELPQFPGGAEIFETLAVYCYTGEIFFSVSNLAVMNCVIEFLDMRDEIRESVQRFLDQLCQNTEDFRDLLQVISSAETLAETQPQLFHSAIESTIEMCINALVQRKDFLDTDAILQLFTLPSKLFNKLTQKILSLHSSVPDSRRSNIHNKNESYVLAKLVQLYRDAQCTNQCNQFVVQQCMQLLRCECDQASVSSMTDKMETSFREPLEFTLSMTNDVADKMLVKFIDDNLGTSSVPQLDACVLATSDSFYFDAYTLSEAFIV